MRLKRFDQIRLADGAAAIEMRFQHGREERVVIARKLILAMPRRSLELLEQTGVVLSPQCHEVHRLIQSVTDLPIRQCYYWPVGEQAQGAPS